MKPVATAAHLGALLATALALTASAPAFAQAEGSGAVSATPVVSPTGTSTVQQKAPRTGPSRARKARSTARRSAPVAPLAGESSMGRMPTSPTQRSETRNMAPMPTPENSGDAGMATDAPPPN